MPIARAALFYNRPTSPAPPSRGDALPVYEYKCTTCGENFELMQSMSEDALDRCKASFCVRTDGKRKGNGRISRRLFAPAIHFKGTGFHNTDYGSKRRPGTDDGDAGSKKDGDSAAKKDGASNGAKDASASSGSSSSDSSSKKTVGLDSV